MAQNHVAVAVFDAPKNDVALSSQCSCSWIGQLQGLRFLNAMCNQVQRVPDELCHLSALYRLGLKSNVLTDLPAGIGKLSGLVELFLTDNQLTHLPDSLGMCTNLVKLQVRAVASCTPADTLLLKK